MTIKDVLSGKSSWGLGCGDCLEQLRALPDDCCSLCFGSPPYELARLYLEGGKNLGIARKTEEWVAWMFEVIRECVRVCTGLTAFVVDGQTKKFRFSCGPQLLMADLHRAGFNLRRPAVFHRLGIPGSGGPDWLRGDCESIICVTRPGKLPWSDNTACGHPPKWAPGGEMSNRTVDGKRANAWHSQFAGGNGSRGQGRKASGAAAVKQRLKRRVSRGSSNGDTLTSNSYAVAPNLTFLGLRRIVTHYADAEKTDPSSILQDLRIALDSQTVSEWLRGVLARLPAETILQSVLHGETESSQGATERIVLPSLPDTVHAVQDGRDGLWPEMPIGYSNNSNGTSELATDSGAYKQMPGEEGQGPHRLRKVRREKKAVNSSHRREPIQQRSEQPGDSVQPLPRQASPSEGDVRGVWETSEGTRLLREAFGAVQEAWRPALKAVLSASPPSQSIGLAIANPGNVVEATYTVEQVAEILRSYGIPESEYVHCLVGGGVMGNRLCHENEAPFPEKLAAFFIRSFAEPGSIVLDPFSGSGTTVSVALAHGRRGIGFDLRQSQIDLAAKRISQTDMPLLR